MSLLIPDSGLLFWMLLVFGVVVFVLAKYGFPVIIKMVEERKAFIDESMVMAEKARTELETVKVESQKILDTARREHLAIINDATAIKDSIINDAKSKALVEANKIIEDARVQINSEKQEAIKDIRRQVAILSVDIAEKVLKQKLESSDVHENMIDRLINEINISKF
jgi:F-type H+-transporting ATPase subunit b